MAKVTRRTVDALRPEPGRDVLLWDDELPGFGVRVRPGGGKTYFLKYRTADGRQRWLTLGRHGSMTPDQARRRALQEKAAVGRGADPSGDRQAKRREATIADVADRYLVEHVAAHNRPSTAAEVTRIVEKRIKPGIGSIKIGGLTRSDVKTWHQSMASTPYEANRALAYLSKMLTLAATDWELRPDNPCTGIKRFPERKRDRYFDDDELIAIGEALAAAERDNTAPPGFVLLVRLLATTGMRLGEVLALDWRDVDLPGRSVRLRDAKAGARTVHLGGGAVAILAAITEQDGPVIVGVTASGAEHAWRRLRTRAGIPDGRLHDLRHTVGTLAALAGANAFAVRDLLGHKTLAMTGRYVERAADMVRATADTVSSRVAAALAAGADTRDALAPPAPIVRLRRTR